MILKTDHFSTCFISSRPLHLEVLLTIVGALALGRALEQSCLAKCNLPVVLGQKPQGFVEFGDFI